MSGKGVAPRKMEIEEDKGAKDFLEVLGVEPTPERVQAVVNFVQNNTTIHARESDPYLPDADNAEKWNRIVPGSAEKTINLISDVVSGNRSDAAEINKIRRENERQGFNVARPIALGCVPIAIAAAYFGIPTGLCIAIVVMGIGGPTAASFFGNWGGKGE